jgi:alpha/beta superfamily hydrolase
MSERAVSNAMTTWLAQSEISDWSQFGLAGVIIASLLAGFAITGKWLMSMIDKMSERQIQDGREWRASVQSIEKTLDELSDRVKDLDEHLRQEKQR